jgi:4-hydroxybutyrate CoA-transferase
MMDWQDKYRDKLITAKEAAGLIKSGMDIIFAMMDQPKDIMQAVCERCDELENVTMTSHWVEDYPFLHPGQHPEMARAFRIKDPMTLRTTREAVREKTIDYQPTIFGLSNGYRQEEPERGRLYHYKDIFYFKLTPPDENGRCSFGPHCWYTPSVCRTAKAKVAEIDPNLAWVYGEYVDIDDIDYLVDMPEKDRLGGSELLGMTPPAEEFEIAQVIGANAATLIGDGDTLQIGVGTAAEAIKDFLYDKNDLGIDSEVIYSYTIDLVKKGNVTGKNKNIDTGIVTASNLQLYGYNEPASIESLAYVRNNPAFLFRDISTQCNVGRIASQNNLVAINNILTVDLLGQIVVTHIGSTPISGPGGQVDYNIGSHYSRGGRSISMLKSTAMDGKVSRIVPMLEPGTVVMIPMVYCDYIVTEYGVANLDCKSRRERAEALISIAHPDFRDELTRAARKMFYPD